MKKRTDLKDFFACYRFIRQHFAETAILESHCMYNPETAKYDIIGVQADSKIYESEAEYYQYFFQTGRITRVDWLKAIDQWYAVKGDSAHSVYAPGVIGYIGYEEKYTFEKLDRILKKDHTVPSVYLVHYRLMLIREKASGQMFWCYAKDHQPEYDALLPLLELQIRASCREQDKPGSFHVSDGIAHDYTEEEYLSAIARAIDHIKKGDIFQANITMRIHGYYHGDPFVLYEKIRDQLENPFFGYLDFIYPLISTSPERFIKITGRRIETNPIKGTIPVATGGIDQGVKLRNSLKNRAENVMITDLMRNDIGRICKKDTVTVPALCELKRFNDLYHLESVVKGELAENPLLSQILKAVFPGGSITGAPKIKAMDIIESLEKTVRGPYTGMLTFFNQQGYLDAAVAIRIIYFDKKRFYLHSGGGIVVKSSPDEELREFHLKINRLQQMLMQCLSK